MTLFTPALLFFVPLWATACLVAMSTAQSAPVPVPRRTKADEDGPESWAAMPFTPPTVHAA